MNGPEAIVAEAGGFLLLGAVLAVTREAVRRNWIKVSFSFGITTPDARLLKPPPKAAQKAPPEPVAETAPLRKAGAA